MEKHADRMAVDPVSPTANPKEKEAFDQQPTAPRRNSIEDQDASRPRKRLATMGSTTPQSSSPPTDKEDGGPAATAATATPPTTATTTTTATATTSTTSSATTTATAAATNPTDPSTPNTSPNTTPPSDSSAPTPSLDDGVVPATAVKRHSVGLPTPLDVCVSPPTAELSQDMSRIPCTPPQAQVAITTESAGEEEDTDPIALSASASPSKSTVNVRPPRPSTAASEQNDDFEALEHPSIGIDEEAKKISSPSPSVTSGSRSPWQEGSGRSPEVEVEELDGMEEDDNLVAESVTMPGPDPRTGIQTLQEFGKCLEISPCPSLEIQQIEIFIGRFLDSSIDGDDEIIFSNWEIWTLMPAVISCFIRRRDPLSQEFIYQNGCLHISKMLIAFLRLTAKFTELEAKTITESAQTTPNLGFISCTYQQVSVDILVGLEPLFIYLEKEHQIHIHADIMAAIPDLIVNWHILRELRRYLQAIHRQLPEKPKALGFTQNPLSLVQELVRQWLQKEWTRDASDHVSNTLTSQVCETALDIVNSAEKNTKKCLETQVQAINIKDYSYIVELLSLITSCLNSYAPGYGVKLFSKPVEINLRHLPPHDRAEYSTALFKLPMYTSLIRCNRMDGRLMGINKLTDSLLRIWKNLGGDVNPSSALRYMAEDVRRSGIIEYLVGPESHPELIRLSHNIGSFLVVNKCLTNDIREAIWQPLVDVNRDPRIVHAVTKMVMEFMNHMNYDSVVDLCERATQIPFSSFDVSMLDFVGHLLNFTFKRFCEESRLEEVEKRPTLDPAPYHLMVGLIRKAAIAEEEGQTCKGVAPSSISDSITRELINTAQYGPPADVREKICHECIEDIKRKSPSTTGSIIVLCALLQRRPRSTGEINLMINEIESPKIEAELVTAMIEDIASFVESHRAGNTSLRTRKLKARLDLLYWVLSRAPNCMGASQIEKVCNYLIGDQSLGHQERDNAFNTFASLTHPSPFIDYVFRDVYPHLNPRYISPHCLGACRGWVEYINKRMPEIQDDKIVPVQGIEQIWRAALRAPDIHLGLEAIFYLITIYLETPLVVLNPPDVVHATYRSLVERCIRQLDSCSVFLRTLGKQNVDGEQTMAVDISETAVKEKQLEFDRSILVLNELLKRYRLKPKPSPITHVNSSAFNRQIIGAPISIRLNPYDRGTQGPAINFQMGTLDTAEELHKQIVHIVGSANYRALSSGRELHLQSEAQKTLAELGFLDHTHILVQKRASDPDHQQSPVSSSQSLNTIESEILKHFDELYGMLDSQEPQGQSIWNLLRLFPLQDKVRDLLVLDDIPPEDLLPPEFPFRTLYLIQGMQLCLETREGEDRVKYLIRAVKSLISFLMKPEGTINASKELRLVVIEEALGKLIKFLTASPALEPMKECFEQIPEFAPRMINLWKLSLLPESLRFERSGSLAKNVFVVLLEAATYQSAIWVHFINNPECTQAIRQMLLLDRRSSVRRMIGQAMVDSVKAVARSGEITGAEVANFFWSFLVDLLPHGVKYGDQAVELFELSNILLGYLGGDGHRLDAATLNAYFVAWTDMLMSHKVKQVIGRPREDCVVVGYTHLLSTCINLLRGKIACPDLRSRVSTIFRNLLFTPLSVTNDDGNEAGALEQVPCLGPQTREILYRLLMKLAEDSSINNTLLDLLSELVSNDESRLPDGIWNFDRSQLQISSAGRVGLRNLSNTCYLNSLLTQLFMNVPFRSFILGMTIDDPEETQNLLHAIKTLFAKMQNGLMKYADTRDFASAIKDYENNEIDVTVQMDVDEFFNLLFDRLEGQMETAEQKTAFRTYYGGKLVQQVKSKECPHISEREEPFSAIQCDIKGKPNLQESLKAYVEGEIMEGDNKYSCTSCNKHVDAVKRACLKEIPDHLIFHLKRFEFDLHTMVRAKINDTFEFPETIDMRPYTIQYLSDTEPCTTPDLFQLTGVLVHNGTAESGHYYSYIKDRHDYTEQNTPAWFEFNDAEVSAFDPSTIPSNCYGGTDFIGPNKELGQPIAFHKTYSAYMLFYERVNPSHAGALQTTFSRKISIPRELENEILQENERVIRRYCLFDGAYIYFTASLLRQSHALRQATPTPEAEYMVKKALSLALKTYERIGSRIKDSRESDDLFDAIRGLVASSNAIECSREFLRWICENGESLRLLLLRCFHPRIRENVANLILGALSQVRRKGGDYFIRSSDTISLCDEGVLPDVLGAILGLWDTLNSLLKPWDEYFSLLTGISNFGKLEREFLLRTGVLYKCFILFMLDYLDRDARALYPNVAKVIEKNPKRISYRALLEFIESLLTAINFTLPTSQSEIFRNITPGDTAPSLTDAEKYCLFHTCTKDKVRVNTFIFKQVSLNCNIMLTQRLIRMILNLDLDPITTDQLILPLKAALMHGIVLDPANEAGPYLQALVAYCSFIRSGADIKEVVSRVAEEVSTIHMQGGREHLDFFKQLWHSRNLKTKSPTYLCNRVLETVPSWAPPLLCYWEAAIRLETEALLKEKVFQTRYDGTEARKKILEAVVERLPEACFRFVEEKFFKNKEIAQAADERSFDSLIRILELCPRMDVDEDPGYSSRIDGLRNALIRIVEEYEIGSENWAASDVGSDSNQELGDDDSV